MDIVFSNSPLSLLVEVPSLCVFAAMMLSFVVFVAKFPLFVVFAAASSLSRLLCRRRSSSQRRCGLRRYVAVARRLVCRLRRSVVVVFVAMSPSLRRRCSSSCSLSSLSLVVFVARRSISVVVVATSPSPHSRCLRVAASLLFSSLLFVFESSLTIAGVPLLVVASVWSCSEITFWEHLEYNGYCSSSHADWNDDSFDLKDLNFVFPST